jgi:hypothetical protein
MTTRRVKDIRYFATREEMDQAFMNGEMRPGEVFALAEIDPDVLADFLATPWVLPRPGDETGLDINGVE